MRAWFSSFRLWLTSGRLRRTAAAAAVALAAVLVGIVHFSARAASPDKPDKENIGPGAGRTVRGKVRHTLLCGEPTVLDGEAQR